MMALDERMVHWPTACERNAVAYHRASLYEAVVAYVCVGHNEAVVAYYGGSCRAYASVYDHMLSYHVVVADGAVGLLTFPSEILRVGTDYCALVDFVVLSHARAVHYACVGHYLAIVAYLDICIDVSEWMDGDIVANLCRRVDMS